MPANRSVIIAMKGYPFTRKTEFAESIAKSLGCPVLASEDFLKRLTSPWSPEQEFEAFQVICDIAIHHLRSGLFKGVVIDSPLSSKSHLIHLMYKLPGRVIVIECKPTHTYSWRLEFERSLYRYHYPHTYDLSRQSPYDKEVKWYKAKKWEDVEKAIQQHPDYDVTSLSDEYSNKEEWYGFVPKLVVDPLLDCPFEDSSGRYSATQPVLVEAVKYMMTCDQWDGPVIYRQWLQKRLSSSYSSSPLGEKHCSTHGHDLLSNSTAVELEGTQHDETVGCLVCGKQVMRSDDLGHGYCYCKNCSLTLHMECALRYNDDYAGRRRGVIRSGKPYIRCKSCTEAGKGISNQCMNCEFECHLRTPGQSPIAVKHFDTKAHFLTVILYSNNMEVYRCFACGEYNKCHMYLCKDCGFTYHYQCVTMPRRVKNVHGGHHHHMSLKFESEEAEDYICQECQELRDPTLWYYSCEDCPGYELHPHCVAKLRNWKRFQVDREWIDKEEIEAAEEFHYRSTKIFGSALKMFDNITIKMKESESISDFYSRVIYLIQWYGVLRNEARFIDEILGSLPLKFYHIVVAIKRSEEYESMSMTVDQLMISLRVYEKKIDSGEDVLIEQVLANLYATQRSSSIDNYYYWLMQDEKLIMNAEDVSLESVLDTDYSKQERGENWVKHWGKYWDNYWFNYQKGYNRSQDESKVQCSICYMFGHDPRHCWSVLDTVTVGPRIVQSQAKTDLVQKWSLTSSYGYDGPGIS